MSSHFEKTSSERIGRFAPRPSSLDRRRFLATVAATATAMVAGGCIPLDRLTSRYRRMLDDDRALEITVLAAFVDAVIPGLDTRTLDSPVLTRHFLDHALPFAPYHLDFSAHLCKRADAAFGDWRYHTLEGDARRHIVATGLDGGRLVRRLYTGAVFITQAATYAAIYDDFGGCPLIEFEGSSQPLRWSEISYPGLPLTYEADAACPGGQPA